MKEELDRKTVETLESILVRLDQGRITMPEARQAVDAMWRTVSGLISDDVMEMIDAFKADTNKAFVERRVFVLEGKDIAILERAVGTGIGRVRMNMREPGVFATDKMIRLEDEINPSMAARQKLDAFVVALKKKGYTEL